MYTEVFATKLLEGLSENNSYILMLTAPERGLNVPILIGDYEAQAIVMAQEQLSARRPMTHDLFGKVLSEFGLEVKSVTIDRFLEGIFYATLYVTDGFNEKRIDSRTSDAVVLALLHKCPIMMNEAVIDEVGISPQSIHNNLPQNKPTESLEELEKLLKKYEENEEYEKAAEIQKRIDELLNC